METIPYPYLAYSTGLMQKQWLFLFTYSWDNSSGFAWHQTFGLQTRHALGNPPNCHKLEGSHFWPFLWNPHLVMPKISQNFSFSAFKVLPDHNSTNDRTNVWLTFSLSCCFEAHNVKREWAFTLT